MVPGFRHLPGHHCGSTALRNLLAFHGLEISEEMAFGLGAGACFYYVSLDGQSPSRFLKGRVRRLEERFLELTGARLRSETFDHPDAAWDGARATVDSGRPALLLTDLYHLDHYGSSARFPGHAVVLAGYDDEVAYLADTAFEELQTTRLESLARARHGTLPIFPLEGQMLTVDDGSGLEDPVPAAPRAISRAAEQMLRPELGEHQGLPALRRFATEVEGWPQSVGDWRWCARLGYQVIERRGTGGGNFRRMYARFLAEVAEPAPAAVADGADLAAEAAERWSALGSVLLDASEVERPEAARWRRIASQGAAVLEGEERLWATLAAASGSRT